MPSDAEHLDVAAVVLEREPQVEAGRAQLPHRRLLEVAGQLVVAPRPHDQQVPADLVAAQPRLGEVVHPVRAGGEQHDLEVGGEQVEDACGPLRSPGLRRTRRRTTRQSWRRRLDVVLAASTRRRARRRCRRRPPRPGSTGPSRQVQCSGRNRIARPLGRDQSSLGRGGEVARLDAVDDAGIGERRGVAERLVLARRCAAAGA